MNRKMVLLFMFLTTLVIFSKQVSSEEYNVKEVECLVEAIYFESRSEIFDGQIAVGNVILNRVSSDKFPNTICHVVHAGHYYKNGLPIRKRCAFSYWCDGKSERMVDAMAYRTATDAAILVLAGFVVKGLEKSLYYHADYVKPDWVNERKFLRKLGTHVFYK